MAGGYEGAEAFRRRTFGNLGERNLFLRLGTVFSGLYFFGLEFGWIFTGVHRFLGVFGSGARIPHGILELGIRIGSVPS